MAGMAGGRRLPATHYRKSADRQLGRTTLLVEKKTDHNFFEHLFDPGTLDCL